MRLIKPSFEIIEQESGLDGLYKHIERCGRLSYRSEDKITEESAKPFVDRMVNNGHGAVLEHGTVYLKFSDIWDEDQWVYPATGKYIGNKYSKVITRWEGFSNHQYLTYYITTNYRVLLENGWLDDLQYLCKSTEYHEPRISVKFTCSRSISHELVRHRVFSFIQESQRYVGYNKSKFGGEITYIIPSKLSDIPEEVIGLDNIEYWEFLNGEKFGHIGKLNPNIDLPINKETCRFLDVLKKSEKTYLQLISLGWKPQEAREVLPNATKTEIIMTGFLSDWIGDEGKKKGFFPLRCDSAAHPDMRALAIPLREEFIKRGWIND